MEIEDEESQSSDTDLDMEEESAPKCLQWKKESAGNVHSKPPRNMKFSDHLPRFNEHDPAVDSTSSPYLLFKTFVHDEIVRDIVFQTNK